MLLYQFWLSSPQRVVPEVKRKITRNLIVFEFFGLSWRGYSSDIEPDHKSRSDLTAIFSWLRRNHVKKIIKVTVIDYGDRSHTDAAIETGLKDFEVELWDWKKVDLCSEVIYNSTKVVREISLYSSGNYAVMMGWASAEGFGNRKKFPEVRFMCHSPKSWIF
jgi:hypothetical protein